MKNFEGKSWFLIGSFRNFLRFFFGKTIGNQIKCLTKCKFYVIYLFFFIKGYFSTFENRFLNPFPSFFSLFLGFSYPFLLFGRENPFPLF